ncbi:hypothetical protein AHAS_Ahas05G0086300 [Arachis hypogaea]
MSWITHFSKFCDWYTHLLHTSPTKSIHLYVFDNSITSNSDNVHHILKIKFHNYSKDTPFSILRKAIRHEKILFRHHMQILIWNGLRVLHSFSPEVQAGRQFRPRIQAISTASNVIVAAHMKTEAITKYLFEEEAEGCNRISGQCGHGDDRTEGEGDGNNDDGS